MIRDIFLLSFVGLNLIVMMGGCSQNKNHVTDPLDKDSETILDIPTDTATDVDAGIEEPEEPPRGWVSHEGALKTGETWARGFGGIGLCEAHAVEIGPDGAIYLTGWFTETVDFDPSDNDDSITSPRSTSVFLTRYEASGEYAWTMIWGSDNGSSRSTWGNQGWSLAIGEDNSIYLGGQFTGHFDLDPGPSETAIEIANYFGPFILKLNENLTFAWGQGWDAGRIPNISLSQDRVFVSGQGNHLEFDLGDQDVALEWNRLADCFAASFSTDGEIQWARAWGGDEVEYNCRSALFQDGIVVVGTVGWTIEDMDPGPGYDPPPDFTDFVEPFLFSFDEEGTRILAEIWGGSGGDNTEAVATTEEAAFVVGGLFYEMEFGTVESPSMLTYQLSGSDAYLMRIEKDGTRAWVRGWGGDERTRANDVVVNHEEVLVAGYFEGNANFNTENAPEIISAPENGKNTFIRAFDVSGNRTWLKTISGDNSTAWSIAERDGYVAVTGTFSGENDLDFGAGPDVWNSPGINACYVARFPLNSRASSTLSTP